MGKILLREVKKRFAFSKYLLKKLEKEGKLLPIGRNSVGERIYLEEDIKKFIDSLPQW